MVMVVPVVGVDDTRKTRIVVVEGAVVVAVGEIFWKKRIGTVVVSGVCQTYDSPSTATARFRR